MILSVGEILIDEINNKPYPGGAPFNVAVNIKQLGGDTIFIGTVGEDEEGRFLINEIKEYGLNEKYIEIARNKKTTKAIVTLTSDGERSFRFERDDMTDTLLPYIDDSLLDKADIIHLGSLPLSSLEGRTYMEDLIKRAHNLHKEVSFDVNYRSDIYQNEEEAIKISKYFSKMVDILKISEEEIPLLGEEFIEKELKDKMVFISKGKKGSECLYLGNRYSSKSIKVNSIDTVGAGDAYMAAILYMLDKKKDADMEEILKFANEEGAKSTLHFGAISPHSKINKNE